MIYERIKKLCTEKRLSIRKLEEQAGLGNGVISGWKESSPRVDNLQSVANVLGVPIEYLIKGELSNADERGELNGSIPNDSRCKRNQDVFRE